MLLESRDHEVIDAPDGPSALEILTTTRPDIAFIDIGLPAMDGYAVARQIRERAELEQLTLIALSGYGTPADVANAIAAGFDHHVIKPAPLARLEELLATVGSRGAADGK